MTLCARLVDQYTSHRGRHAAEEMRLALPVAAVPDLETSLLDGRGRLQRARAARPAMLARRDLEKLNVKQFGERFGQGRAHHLIPFGHQSPRAPVKPCIVASSADHWQAGHTLGRLLALS